MFHKIFDPLFFKNYFINFIGLLIFLTVIRWLVPTNPFLFTFLAGAWFIVIFFFDLHHFKDLLSTDWQSFKAAKGKMIVSIICLMLILEVAVIWSSQAFRFLVPTATSLNTYPLPTNTLAGVLTSIFSGIVNLMVALVEEIAYRYVGMFRYRKAGIWLIIMLLLSSILFGFSHFYNFNGSFIATVPYMLAGLILGLAYLLTRNIWVPIIGHMLFNSIGLISGLVLLVLLPFM